MCDIQILTGMGILLSSYIGLSCYVSANHWQLAVQLAWFSNITHVACLTVLRGYLHLHSWERNIRISCMTVLCLALIVSMSPTAYFGWAFNESLYPLATFNARCFFDPGFGKAFSEQELYGSRRALESTIMSILLLFFNFLTRTIKFMKPWADSFRKKCREAIRQDWMASTTRSVERHKSGENSITYTMVSVFCATNLGLQNFLFRTSLT